MPAVSDRLRYILEADPSNFVKNTKKVRQAQAQLERGFKQMESGSNRLSSSSGKSRQALQSLGFMMNDVQQFSYGASAGVRAISNNLSMLAVGMGAGGATILALEAGATVMALFADELFRGSEGADRFAKSLKTVEENIAELRRGAPEFGLSGSAAVRARLGQLRGDLDKFTAERDLREARILDQFPGLERGTPEFRARRLAAGLGAIDAMIKENERLIAAREEELALILEKEGAEERNKNLASDQLDLATEKLEIEQEVAYTFQEQAKRRMEAHRRELDIIRRVNDVRRQGFIDDAEEAGQGSLSQAMRFGVLPEDNLQDVFKNMDKLKTEGISTADALSSAFGNFGGALQTVFQQASQQNESLFRAMKAFAIAEATINTYTAATKALKAGPILGPILAGSIIATGLAMVATIASTKPGGGGGGSRPSVGARSVIPSERGPFVGGSPVGNNTVSAIPAGISSSSRPQLHATLSADTRTLRLAIDGNRREIDGLLAG